MFYHKGICLGTVLLGTMAAGLQAKGKAVQPNVIFIFPDQYRNFSLGFWSEPGNEKYIQGAPDPVVTPTLNKLAKNGLVFSRAVSNYPLCSPYRGMLLTGMYPDHNGIVENCKIGREAQLKTDAECITDVYAKAGYEVAYFGKCHWQKTEPLFNKEGTYIGSAQSPGGEYINTYDTYVPPGKDRHSIHYFYQALTDNHYNPLCYTGDPLVNNNLPDGHLYQPKKFSAENEADIIVKYLKNSHNQRDTKKPFFMIWSLNPPHNPWTEESTNMTFFKKYYANTTFSGRFLNRENADTTVGAYAPYYFANVSAVDFYIGQVLDQIKKMGLDKNTIVVFSSDHGEMLGSHALTGKNTPETEALNIPFVIKWPGKIKPRIEDLMISVPDMMPTILGLSGLQQMIPAEVQGTDYSSIILNPDSALVPKPKSALYYNTGTRGVFTGQYTFVVAEKNGRVSNVFYYDNVADPYQEHKISGDKMDKNITAMLKKALRELLKSTNDSWYTQGICKDFLMN